MIKARMKRKIFSSKHLAVGAHIDLGKFKVFKRSSQRQKMCIILFSMKTSFGRGGIIADRVFPL